MTDSERIAGYLQHILDAIDRATTYANKAVTFAVFEQDVLLQDGVIRASLVFRAKTAARKCLEL
jgi:uncharacterized protein with HEPN domain